MVFNSAATAAASGWTILLTIVSVPILLDGLGIASFGLWALLQTFAAVTGWLSLADFGIGLAATSRVADESSRGEFAERNLTVGTTLRLFLAIGFVFAALIAIVGPGLFVALFEVPTDLTDAARFAVSVFAVQVAFDLLASGAVASLDGVQRVDLSRLSDATRRTAVLTAASATALAGGGLRGVAVAAAIASGASSLFSLGLLRSQLGSIPVRGSARTARQLLRYGRTVWTLGVTGVMHRTMDRLIVGIMIGPKSVALVEIANQVQNGVASVLAASTYTVASGAAWIHARKSFDRLRELVLRGAKYSSVTTIPACAVIAILAVPVITTWLGDEQAEAAGLVRLALLYLAIQTPLAVGTNVLVGTGRAGRIVRPALLAVLVNLAASIVLVDRYGVVGALLATNISAVVLTPLLLRVLDADLGVSPSTVFRQGFVPAVVPTVGGSLAAAVVLLAPFSPVVTTVVGGVAGVGVAALLVTTVALNPAERQEFRRTISR